MSKKNIVDKVKVDNNTVHVKFKVDDGNRTYEYKGSSMRAIMRGRDPQSLTGGKLIKHEPKETK